MPASENLHNSRHAPFRVSDLTRIRPVPELPGDVPNSPLINVHSTHDASLQIERLSSTNNFTAPAAGRFFKVMAAFAPVVSPRSTASVRSHALFAGCRIMVTGSTVR